MVSLRFTESHTNGAVMKRVEHIFTIKDDLENVIFLEEEVKEDGWSIVCKRLFKEKYGLDEMFWDIRIDPMWGEDACLYAVLCFAESVLRLSVVPVRYERSHNNAGGYGNYKKQCRTPISIHD